MSKPAVIHDGTGVLETIPGYGITRCAGIAKPADGTAGYAVGCLFQNLAGGAGTALYVNEGTAASCDFDAVTVA
jgi:hypothetical protein